MCQNLSSQHLTSALLYELVPSAVGFSFIFWLSARVCVNVFLREASRIFTLLWAALSPPYRFFCFLLRKLQTVQISGSMTILENPQHSLRNVTSWVTRWITSSWFSVWDKIKMITGSLFALGCVGFKYETLSQSFWSGLTWSKFSAFVKVPVPKRSRKAFPINYMSNSCS